MPDIAAATAFMSTHARLVDRRRLDVLLNAAPRAGLLAALTAYRNDDGGFGWGLEADLRAPSSQPAGALHAFELLEEAVPLTSPLAAALCDWLDAVTLADGGLPFALAGADQPGTAPWWAGADPTTSSLHITSAVCAAAHRLRPHDPAVADHRWLRRATDFCLGALAGDAEPVVGYELRFVLELLDAAADAVPEAGAQLARLARLLPPSGELPVRGGVEDEKLRPLDYAPWPERPLREHLAPTAIERDLDRLEQGQREDGGWAVDFPSSSPAGALEWRGYATVRALAVLRANGRLPAPGASRR
jgi:hypothetical protein